MAAPSCIVFSCRDPAAPVPVGRFAVNDDGQGERSGDGRFGYGLRYVQRPDAFDLDPVHLPLSASELPLPRHADGSYGVLSDAGPNAWGARLTTRLLREADEAMPSNAIDWLLRSWHYGSGCLGFSASPDQPPRLGIVPADSAALSRTLLQTLDDYTVNPDAELDDESIALLFPGSSLGGVRPKTVVMHDGAEHIAKFSRPDDRFDVPAVEYATLRLAFMAGIDVPSFELIQVGNRSVLLVQRFDRAGPRRLHYLSAHSLLDPRGAGIDGNAYKTSFSYAGIAEALRPIGEQAGRDAHQLFRRMVFNILVGNVDDHLRNHALLLAPSGRYRLSPAFDIVPHPEAGISPQSIGVGALGRASTIGNALSQCGRFLLTNGDARQMVDHVSAVVARWRTVLRESGVGATDVHALARCFQLG
jgi:serine/threonine-protein kinase HipA